MTNCETLQLTDGSTMPTVGLGLWKIENEKATQMVVSAIRSGYRHLDAACDYGNESQVGEGIAQAISQGLCKRDEMWVTSKLWNTYHKAEHVRPAIERSLRDLQLDYLDLYLIHFPITLKHVPIQKRYPPGWFYDPTAATPKMEVESVPIAETWQAMEEIHKAGLARHIGISNFNISLIRDLLSTCQHRPTVLQVESHPYLTQEKLLRYCQQERIAYTAFSPLGAGSYIPLGMATDNDSVLGQQLVVDLASKYAKSPAQIVLRWGVQRGTAVIPKTSRAERLCENIQIFDFALTTDEMLAISNLNRNQRFNDPGVFCEQAFGCFYPMYE